MRHLRRLVETLLSLNVRDVSLYSAYIQFAYKNANSIWNNDNSSNSFGFHWSGPVDSTDAARQSSALDAFNTALAFSLFPVNSGSFVGGFAQTAPPSRTDLGIRRSTRKTKFRRNLNQGIY